METILKSMTDNLNMLKKQHSENYTKLKKDLRDDEAKMERIRANIAGIFFEMIRVSKKQTFSKDASDEQNAKKFVEHYKNFFVKIPSTWKESLNEAKQNDDFETVFIEKEKIKMAQKIEKMFDKLTEGYDV